MFFIYNARLFYWKRSGRFAPLFLHLILSQILYSSPEPGYLLITYPGSLTKKVFLRG